MPVRERLILEYTIKTVTSVVWKIAIVSITFDTDISDTRNERQGDNYSLYDKAFHSNEAFYVQVNIV